MTMNSRHFSGHKDSFRAEDFANSNARNPFTDRIGAVAEFSSWGLYHSYAWKLRLALIDSLHSVVANDQNSWAYLKDTSGLLLNLNIMFVGIFSSTETSEIESMIDAINIDINDHLRRKRVTKKLAIPDDLIRKIIECYKKLSLYQQQRNLLLPTTKDDEFANRLSKIEDTFVGE